MVVLLSLLLSFLLVFLVLRSESHLKGVWVVEQKGETLNSICDFWRQRNSANNTLSRGDVSVHKGAKLEIVLLVSRF